MEYRLDWYAMSSDRSQCHSVVRIFAVTRDWDRPVRVRPVVTWLCFRLSNVITRSWRMR